MWDRVYRRVLRVVCGGQLPEGCGWACCTLSNRAKNLDTAKRGKYVKQLGFFFFLSMIASGVASQSQSMTRINSNLFSSYSDLN